MKRIHTLSSILLVACMLTGCGTTNDANVSSGTEATTTSSTTATMTTTETSTTKTTTKGTTTKQTTKATSTTIATTAQEVTTEPVTEPPVPEPETQPEPEPVVETPAEPEEYIGTAEVISRYSEDDAVLLAMLIHHEASGTWDGKMAVGNCVINRMNTWGQTLSGVIYAPGQFTVASYMNTYNDTDYQAAVQLLTSGSTDTRIMYFDGGHGGVNWFYDGAHNYLYAA